MNRSSAKWMILCWCIPVGCAGMHSGELQSPGAASPAPTKSHSIAEAPQPSGYPPTRLEDVVEQRFGQTVHDPYRWLENEKSEEVKQWMAAQDQFAREHLAQLPHREALLARFAQLYYIESMTPPVHRGNRFFYTRRHADKEKAIVYVREGEHGKERTLIDPNTLSEDGSIALHGFDPSYDGMHVVYSLHKNNADYGTIHVMEVKTGEVSKVDMIENVLGGGSWTPKGDGFYYSYYPQSPNVSVADRFGEAVVRFHKLGTNPESDVVVHDKTGDARKWLGAFISRDGHWLIAVIGHGASTNEVYYRDMRKRDLAWRPLATGFKALFWVTAWKDQFYIHTNEGAPNWHVYRVNANRPERERWREIIPENKDAVLESVSVVGGRLALTYMRNAYTELEVRDLNGGSPRKVLLPGIGASTGLIGAPDQDEAYFSFSSHVKTPVIYKTSVKKGTVENWFAMKVPVDSTPYELEQIWFPSKDGTKISMFLVHRKDMIKNGSTPFYMSGYGGFNISYKPAFNPSIYPWLEAGGGYAWPNLRGGNEYGEKWHEAGRGPNKQNVFDDFIAAAEYLISNDYTKSERLAIESGSNGGLLMGAVLTQRPELFRGVVCSRPLLDMVRYHLFGSGKLWIPEYGSADSESEFKTLFAYSPYHHVKQGLRYPSILMLSVDTDDRVDAMHARKMTAILQASGSDRPVWMYVDRHASHGGSDLVRQRVEQSANSYAFLMHAVGLAPPSKTSAQLAPR